MNFEALKNYALWYYTRYFPSKKKLLEKLTKKSLDSDLASQVLENIEHIIDEKSLIESKIQYYLSLHKNLRSIKTKLAQAGFEKEMYESILVDKFVFEEESLLQTSSLRHKIGNYQRAGKSMAWVRQKFIERSPDTPLVEQIIQEIYWDSESVQIQYWIEKLKGSLHRDQLIKKLLSKWFNYQEIKKYV